MKEKNKMSDQTDPVDEEQELEETNEGNEEEDLEEEIDENLAQALKAKGLKLLEKYPTIPEIHMTFNHFGFFNQSEAELHVASLKNNLVLTINKN